MIKDSELFAEKLLPMVKPLLLLLLLLLLLKRRLELEPQLERSSSSTGSSSSLRLSKSGFYWGVLGQLNSYKASLKNSRGDITLVLALMFMVVTLFVIFQQQMIAGNKLKSLSQIFERSHTYTFNEINSWRLFYRNKKGLVLDTPIEQGSQSVIAADGTTTTTDYFPVGKSVPGTSTGGLVTSGNVKLCSGSGKSKLCIGNKPVNVAPLSATWEQEAYIKASNAGLGDLFGQTFSLDGDTLAVGVAKEASNQTTITNGAMPGSPDNSKSSAGAVYIYKRTGSSWAQEAYIKASNSDGGDAFGFPLVIQGDTLVVSAYSEDSNSTSITNGTGSASGNNSSSNSGAVYIYKRSGTTWAQDAYIKASNSENIDHFGWNISIDGDTLVVGAFREDSNQTTIINGTGAGSSDNSKPDSGAVYVYKREITGWAQEAYIKASNSDTDDWFGYKLSLKGDTLAVGVGPEDSNQTTITNGTTDASLDNSKMSSGAVYVYKRTGNTWAQEAYIKASNSDVDDYFGDTFSLDGDTLMVGAPYESADQNTITNGTTAGSLDNSKRHSGAIYVYKRTGATWAQEAYIKSSNADIDDFFGGYLSGKGDTLVVGVNDEDSNQNTITNGSTPASTDNSKSNSGSVYVYKRTGTTWAQEAYIKASNLDTNDWFGKNVFIYGETLVVGSPNEASDQRTITNGDTPASANNLRGTSGAVYVYKRSGSTWAQEAYIKASNADATDKFGANFLISGNTLVVGVEREDSNQTTITNGSTPASTDNSASNSGAVYVYKRTQIP